MKVSLGTRVGLPKDTLSINTPNSGLIAPTTRTHFLSAPAHGGQAGRRELTVGGSPMSPVRSPNINRTCEKKGSLGRQQRRHDTDCSGLQWRNCFRRLTVRAWGLLGAWMNARICARQGDETDSREKSGRFHKATSTTEKQESICESLMSTPSHFIPHPSPSSTPLSPSFLHPSPRTVPPTYLSRWPSCLGRVTW